VRKARVGNTYWEELQDDHNGAEKTLGHDWRGVLHLCGEGAFEESLDGGEELLLHSLDLHDELLAR
jgi:hypothetical protein